jgi:geranylgeranyl diphosphate synthase type II
MERFKFYQKQIENVLVRQDFDEEPRELYQPISYILSLGGKRLRPALTLAGCELFNGELSDSLLPALGIEVFHNFSLVHDDIMDQAELRRGKKTVHSKWNENIAILSGDAMLVKSYQYIAQVDASLLPKVLKCFSDTALAICEGQQMDMNFEERMQVSEEEYLEMISLKTAVLLGAALKIGALIGKASVKQANALYEFGVSAGMAFQIQDDLLDAFGDPEKFGKKPGGDILQDKKTLLMIYGQQEKEWQALEKEDLQGAEKVKAYCQFFEKSGVRERVTAKRDELLHEALRSLENAEAPNKVVKLQLEEFARWLSLRDR